MRISHGETSLATDMVRNFIDQMSGHVGRITTKDSSPYKPGETFDVQIRQADWSTRDPDQIMVREYNRATGERTSANVTVTIERVHIY